MSAPLKTKITLWLSTWDNDVKTGWVSPSRCALCKTNKESSSHIFIRCPYEVKVMNIVMEELKPKSMWSKARLEDYLKDWLVETFVKKFEGFPCIMVYGGGEKLKYFHK
jgi:hypothetical protein